VRAYHADFGAWRGELSNGGNSARNIRYLAIAAQIENKSKR